MEDNIEIDPQMWLDFLLAQLADEQTKQELIEDLARKSGVAPDKVEDLMHSLTEILLEMTRSN